MVEWEKKMSNGNDKFKEFFETHQVFNSDEFQRHCAVSGYHARNVLSKYTRSRHIRKLRNKLYTVLPEGSSPESFMPSPLLVAAKSSDDSVLSYSSALAYYGMARNISFNYPYLSRKRGRRYRLGKDSFQPSLPPKKLKNAYEFGVTTQTLWKTPVRVVCKERLLVDSLDRLNLTGGWEEISNAFQYENSLDWKVLLEYLTILNNPATSARVGFFLDRFKSEMNVPDYVLDRIETMKPAHAEYFYRNYRKGHLNKKWNLFVTDEMDKQPEEDYGF